MIINKYNILDVFKAKQKEIKVMENRGYKLIEELFADNSGLGASDEMALTQDQLITKVTDLIEEHEELDARITGVGQFQIYIGLFKKLNK